jgi:anti-sigma regulatory factor (Ser/Thr protein kinase)
VAQMRAVIDIPGRTSQVAAARAIVGAIITAWGLPDRVDDAKFVASELLTNAIDHAPGQETYELELEQRDVGLRVSLADGSSISPVVAQLDHARPRGRGIRLIEAFATSWGSEEYRGGKRVWVDL